MYSKANQTDSDTHQDTPAVIHVSESFALTKTGNLTVDIATWQDTLFLRIYRTTYSDRYTGGVKGAFIAFKAESVVNLVSVVASIPTEYELREYGMVGKYKVYVSTYEGSTNFQIREWLETKKYTGFARHGVSVPVEKLSEFRSVLEKVASRLEAVARGESISELPDTHSADRTAFF